MNRCAVAGVAIVFAYLLGPLPPARGQPNKADAQKQAAEQQEKLLNGGTWVGRIARMDKARSSFTFEVELRIPYVEIVHRTGADGRIRTHIYQRVLHETQRAVVWVPEDTKVRVPLKPVLDPGGRPQRGTPAEDLSDPDSKLGGSPGKVADLRAGQPVRAVLERNRKGQLFAKVISIGESP